MVRVGRERLRGVVEVDESYIAITDRENPVPALLRKSHTDKIMIGMAVELVQPKGFGRIRLRQLPSDSKEYVRQFIEDSIEPGAVVRTDGSGSYAKLEELGYTHERCVMLGSDTPAHVSMAGVHRVASLLKRWILGTITARFNQCTWTHTSMSSSFASIGDPRRPAVCSSIVSFSKPW
jgi:hypothetical protein